MDAGELAGERVRVLLIGRQWGALSGALTVLRNAGKVLVSGPVTRGIEGMVAETQPSLMIVSPDFGYDRVTGLGRRDRDQDPQVPILLCIAHGDPAVEDLYEEADDLLVIPCSSAELDTRIMRLALKHRAFSAPFPLLQVGKLALDVATYRVTLDGSLVELAWMEFQLLKFLMQNPGKVFTREHLLARVWEAQAFVGTRTVDVHIRRLRHKLGASGGALFRTVKNVGYGLVESE